MIADLRIRFAVDESDLCQLAAAFGTSKPAAAQVIDDLGPALTVRTQTRFPRGMVLIVDPILVPTRDRSIAAQSKNYRYSTNQVVIDADTELVAALERPLPGNRNDCRAYASPAPRNTTVIADGGYQGTTAIIPHRRKPGRELPACKQAHNACHRQVRARVEHVFARMKTWKILRDCRLRGNGVAVAMAGVARLANLATQPDIPNRHGLHALARLTGQP